VGIAYRRGTLLYSHGRYDMAIDEFRKELEEDPTNSLAMAMIASCLTNQGRQDEAIVMAKSAIAASPMNAFAHYILAWAIIGTFVKYNQKRTFKQFLASRIFAYRSRLKRAKPYAKEAVRLNPVDPRFLVLMAMIELDLNRPKKALEWCERSLAVRPDHIDSINIRARSLAKLGRRDEARQASQSALQLDPNGAQTHAQGGWTHLQMGDREQAATHFQESIRIDPNSRGAHLGLKQTKIKIKLPRKWVYAVRVFLLGSIIVQAVVNKNSGGLAHG
jgi:tetratricopeptide (TPR) repeat protein